MDKEDLFKLARSTSDDDSQAPEDVVKALLGVAAKGKPPAVKELSDWLINRLGETESARVKLKVLRLMMQIMASKKGAKFKAQLREDGGPILRATTNFETEIDPEHGEKPMLFVRKSAVKCLTLLELSTTAEPAAAPAAGGTADGASLAERKKALAERKAALESEQTAAAAPAPAPKPAARAPAVSAAPTVAPSVAAAPPATATPSGSATGGAAAAASADIDALVQARVDAAMAAIAPKIAAAVRVTERMDKLERNVEEKVAEVRREAQQAQERLAVAEVEWTERLEKAQAEAERASGFAELDQRLRDALDAAANTVAEGGEAGLATKWELKWEEIGSRVSAIEAAGMTAAAESRAKSESLAGLLLQLRKRANAAEEDTARITHSLEQLDSRLDSAREALMTEVQLVSSSAASASASSADSSALDAMQAQLAEVDRKFSEANQAQATWLEEQLTQAAVESSTAVAAAEQTAQRAAIDAEGKALSAVTAAVEGFEDTMNVVEDRITFMEESMEAGIGDRCEGIESEVQSISSIVLAMKSGQDNARDKLASHSAQLEEFEQLGTLVEDAVESSNGDIDLLKQEFGTFKEGVEGATEGIKSLVARVLATEEENYDTVLAEANLSSVIEYNRAAGRRLVKLTKSVERLGDKVEACHKGQQSAWQAISEMQGRMTTIRDTVVRMTR